MPRDTRFTRGDGAGSRRAPISQRETKRRIVKAKAINTATRQRKATEALHVRNARTIQRMAEQAGHRSNVMKRVADRRERKLKESRSR